MGEILTIALVGGSLTVSAIWAFVDGVRLARLVARGEA